MGGSLGGERRVAQDNDRAIADILKRLVRLEQKMNLLSGDSGAAGKPKSAVTKEELNSLVSSILLLGGFLPADAPMFRIIETTASVTAEIYDSVIVDATAANRNVTLPPVAGRKGKLVAISKSDATANTVTAVGTINGVANYVLTLQDESIILEATDTGWRTISL